MPPQNPLDFNPVDWLGSESHFATDELWFGLPRDWYEKKAVSAALVVDPLSRQCMRNSFQIVTYHGNNASLLQVNLKVNHLVK